MHFVWSWLEPARPSGHLPPVVHGETPAGVAAGLSGSPMWESQSEVWLPKARTTLVLRSEVEVSARKRQEKAEGSSRDSLSFGISLFWSRKFLILTLFLERLCMELCKEGTLSTEPPASRLCLQNRDVPFSVCPTLSGSAFWILL